MISGKIVSFTAVLHAARLAVVPQSPTLPKGFRLFKIRQGKRQNWYAQAVVTEDGDAIEAGVQRLGLMCVSDWRSCTLPACVTRRCSDAID